MAAEFFRNERAMPELPPFGWNELRRVFMSWERYRLLYNAALVLVCVATIWEAGLSVDDVRANRPLVFRLIFGAIVANAAFWAGPMVESYLTWIGRPERQPRIALLVGGTIFAAVLAVATIATVLAPQS